MVLSERGGDLSFPLLRGDQLKNMKRVIRVFHVRGLGEAGMHLGCGSEHILISSTKELASLGDSRVRAQVCTCL